MNHHSNNRCNLPGALGVMILCFFQSVIVGQIFLPGKPYPFAYKNSPDIIIHEIGVTEEQRSQAMHCEEPYMLKPALSGMLFDVGFTPLNAGIWDTLPDGSTIWRAAFRVEKAILMSIIFSPYELNTGVKLFIYDRDQKNTIGAFTEANNKSINLLATSQIPGDVLIVEMQVPAYLGSYGSLGISGIGCDFSDDKSLQIAKDGWFGLSGYCNPDILCSDDAIIKRVKNAVVRIVFQGHQRCTGTLVNTTQHKGINYILTAGHCFTNEEDANSAVFYFEYESPSCDGRDGNSLKSVSGSTIRARSNKVDFALLELFEPIPVTYHPYYAGWDYSGRTPESGVVIHHPLGDVKKFGIEADPLRIASFGSLYDDRKHWLVSQWESGTTEPGSSGAPFFDPSGRITGTLTGGQAECGTSERDYFQMFSHSWKDYDKPGSQLATWLDPLNLGQETLDGYDPNENFWLTGDTLSNIGNNESLKSENGLLEWGSYSGHNSSLTTEFAEKFVTDFPVKMQGILLNIDKNYVARELRSIKVKIWSGTQAPQNIIYEKTVLLADLIADTLNFVEFDTIVPVNQIFFAGYKLYYNLPVDTFSVYMAESRPLNGMNTAFVYDGDQWHSLSDFTGGLVNTSFAIFPVVFDSLPESEAPDFENNIMAYPNPAASVIRLRFREMSPDPVRVSMFNTQGQRVFDQNYGPYQHIIPVSLQGISAGIYLIHVKQGNITNNLKIAVVK